MRHDPASAAVVVMLRSLKMYGIPKQLFADILRLIAELRPPPDPEAA